MQLTHPDQDQVAHVEDLSGETRDIQQLIQKFSFLIYIFGKIFHFGKILLKNLKIIFYFHLKLYNELFPD